MGDKVRCIHNDYGRYDITIGKLYEIESISSEYVSIIDDMGKYRNFYLSRFEPYIEGPTEESNDLFPIY